MKRPLAYDALDIAIVAAVRDGCYTLETIYSAVLFDAAAATPVGHQACRLVQRRLQYLRRQRAVRWEPETGWTTTAQPALTE